MNLVRQGDDGFRRRLKRGSAATDNSHGTADRPYSIRGLLLGHSLIPTSVLTALRTRRTTSAAALLPRLSAVGEGLRAAHPRG